MLSAIITIILLLGIGAAIFFTLRWLWNHRHKILAWTIGVAVLILCPYLACKLFDGWLPIVLSIVIGYLLFRFIRAKVEDRTLTVIEFSRSIITPGYMTSDSGGVHDVSGHWRTSVLGNVHWVSDHIRSNPVSHFVSGRTVSRSYHVVGAHLTGSTRLWTFLAAFVRKVSKATISTIQDLVERIIDR